MTRVLSMFVWFDDVCHSYRVNFWMIFRGLLELAIKLHSDGTPMKVYV